jgi:hypothetical protein
MTLLSAADIADLTALDVSGMPGTCTITNVVIGDDGGGGQTETPSIATSICRFVEGKASERSGDQLRERGRHDFYLPKTTVLTITSRITYLGVVYIVVYAPPVDEYRTSRKVGVDYA